MHHPLSFACLALLFSSASALPTTETSTALGLHRRCGTVSQFYGQTEADWQTYNTDSWLSTWVSNHTSDIQANSQGFAGAFGQWAIGNPDWSCRDDGSPSDCDLDPCDNRVLNDKGNDIRPAYYVAESVNRLHSYFIGLSQSFEVSAIAAALSKDSWALTFYKDKDDKSATVLKEILNLVATIVGIGASFAGLIDPVVGAMAGAASAMVGGSYGAASPLIAQHQDDTFQKSADLGGILGQIVVGAMKSFTSANNELMHGDQFQGSDITAYLKGGAFVDFPGVDKNAVIDVMNNFLVGNAINLLWRTQKIFIMGGGACGDNQGIGQGPQGSSVCRNGQAWYLYYWQENDVVSTTSHQWGWVAMPPGADQLGQGDWAGIQIADVINSSLDAYNVAEYNYDASTATSRAEAALSGGWRNPGAQGVSWEGTFTIPVCDVGNAVGSGYFDKAYILQDYGHDSRPVWCGPVCSGDQGKTQRFISAANLWGFSSPKHLCPQDPGY